MAMLTAQEILDLNKDAFNLLSDMIKEQIVDKGNIFLESKCRDDYLEYYFNDGTMIELVVVRDFNDNYKPIGVTVNHYREILPLVGNECNNYYTRLFTDSFKLS